MNVSPSGTFSPLADAALGRGEQAAHKKAYGLPAQRQSGNGNDTPMDAVAKKAAEQSANAAARQHPSWAPPLSMRTEKHLTPEMIHRDKCIQEALSHTRSIVGEKLQIEVTEEETQETFFERLNANLTGKNDISEYQMRFLDLIV